MAEIDISTSRSPVVSTTSLVLQFLSLYLLVLAFFILLVTISTFEEVKSDAVMFDQKRQASQRWMNQNSPWLVLEFVINRFTVL